MGFLAALAGCSAISDRVAPGRAGQRAAQVAFTAVLPQARADGAASVEVRSTYVLRDGTSAPLGDHTFTLGQAKTQSLPLAIDLATCLSNPAHQPSSTGDGCVVRLFVALSVNGVVVDRQVIGPLQLTPGRVETVNEPVSLFEISTLEVALASGGTLPTRPSLEIGSSLSLRAVIRDRNGQVVPDREVTWGSDSPALASADGQGVVRALATGTVRVTATLGSISQSVVVRVIRSPVEVSVRGAPGSGRGRVRSGSAPLDCRIAASDVTGVCSTRFAADSSLVLEGLAEAGSVFGGWEGACAGTLDPLCRVSTTTAVSVAARFTALRRVRVTSSGDGRGRITGPEGLDCTVVGVNTAGVCDVLVPEGTSVVLQATPIASRSGGPESSFAGFAGTCPSARECTYTVGAGDVDVRVAFLEVRRLRVVLDGEGDGRVVATGGIDCRREANQLSGSCALEAAHGTVVVLRATGGAQGLFSSWTGPCTGSGGSECRVTLDADREVAASFTRLRRLVIESAGGDGQGRVTGPGGIDCQLNGTTATGTCVVAVSQAEVPLRVEPGPSQVLAGWSLPCARQVTCQVALGSAETRVGVKLFGEQRVRVTFAGAGGGSVASTTAAIQCSVSAGRATGACEGQAPWESVVTLTATEDSRSRFVRWSGPCASSGRTCQVALTETRVVTAEFAPRMVSLTLTTSGSGGGTLMLDGASACSASGDAGTALCRVDVPIDSRVVLSAIPSSGSISAGLTGDCTGATSCTLVVGGPRSVDARFDLRSVVIRTVLSGAGGGSTQINSATSCVLLTGQLNASCSRTVPYGTTLNLASVANSASVATTLAGPCGTAASCTHQVTADVNLAVRFDPGVLVTVFADGSGDGRVTGGPFDCQLKSDQVSGTCAALFAPGVTVTLVATPAAGSRVSWWSGPCTTRTANSCTVTALGLPVVTAVFAPVR